MRSLIRRDSPQDGIAVVRGARVGSRAEGRWVSLDGPHTDLPWGMEDLVRVALMNAVAAVLIASGWYLAAGRSKADLAAVDLAIAGMVVAGLANAGWLLRGRRAIGERHRELLADLVGVGAGVGVSDVRWTEDAVVARSSLVAGAVDPGAFAPDGIVFVVRSGDLVRFHKAGCALTRDRDLDAMERAASLSTGRLPCGVCSA